MKTKITVFATITFLQLLSSCNTPDLARSPRDGVEPRDRSNENSEKKIERTYGVPFSDTTDLFQFDSDPNIVRFDYARKIAIVDMTVNDYFGQNGWSGCYLSRSPIAIYGFDNKPLFYDFVVIAPGGKAMGTVTVHARRRSAMQIKAMTKGLNFYSKNLPATRSVPGAAYFADIRGNRYIAPLSKAGEQTGVAIDTRTGRSVDGCTFISDEELMARLRSEYLPMIFPDPEQCRSVADSMEARMVEHHRQTAAFWAALAEMDDDLKSFPEDGGVLSTRSLPDNRFTDIFDDGSGSGGANPEPTPTAMTVVVYDDGQNNVAWLKEYSTWFKKYQYSGSAYCGPWVAGFILSTNDDTFLHHTNFDKEGYTVQGGGIRGAMTAPCLNNALRDYSNGEVQIGMATMPTNESYWRIRGGQSMVRLLINWPIQNGLHWTLLYGSHRKMRVFSISIYFMQADNGTIIENGLTWRQNRDERDVNYYDTSEWFDSIFPVFERKTVKS